MIKILSFCLLGLATACAVEDPATATETDDLTIVTGPAFLYPWGTGYQVKGLLGTYCDDGTSAPTCLADALDFSLMPQLTSTQIADLRARFAAGDADPADATVLVTGQWHVVLVHDHRDPTGDYQNYRRIDFQLLSAYRTVSTVIPHETGYYHLTGTTWQQAQSASVTHTLPFHATVDFPVPVLTNAYGVVSDGYVTGTIVQPPTNPVELAADRYFQRL